MSESGKQKSSEEKHFETILNSVTLVLVVVLIAVFWLSLMPNSTIVLDNSRILLLAIIVVLLLSYRFREIQIPGLLRLSNAVESVKKETEALRNMLMQVWVSSKSVSQASANVEIVNTLLTEAERIARAPRVSVQDVPAPAQRTDEDRVSEYFRQGDNTAAFAVLRRLLEKELSTALGSRLNGVYPRGLRRLAQVARQEEIISFQLYDKIDLVRRIANQLIHPPDPNVFFPAEKLNYAIDLGIDAYHELRSINWRMRRTNG